MQDSSLRRNAASRMAKAIAAVAALALLLAPASASAAICEGANRTIAADVDAAERSLLCLVNVYRAGRGVNVLTHDPTLRSVARGHSQDMLDRNFFDHVNPDRQSAQDRATAAGYPGGVGENIAKSGNPGATPRYFFGLWRSSPGHNSNLLDLHGVRTVTAGMGFALQGGTYAGTQMFGTRAAGGTDTALRCAPARAERDAAKRKVTRAKRQVRKRLRALRRADTSRQERKAKRKLKAARRKLRRNRKQLKRATRVVRAACNTASRNELKHG